MDTEIYSSLSEEETFQLGINFAERLNISDVVAFYGDLGAGKTEFIKGICQGLNVDEIVSSPTYTIVNQYSGTGRDEAPIVVFHVDLYRIEKAAELIEAGLYDIIVDESAIKLVEWAENAEAILPPTRYDVVLTVLDDENARRIEINYRDSVPVAGTRSHVLSR